MSKLEIRSNDLLLDGKPFRIICGSMHYFRIFPQYWEERLVLLKSFGLTAVETYVPWNVHEPQEGLYDFDGMYNLAEFLKIADKVGLKVLLRPSPYICSEWDFGGLPWWLLRYSDIQLRCSDQRYMKFIDRYYSRLCKEFVPFLSTNGGPIIAVAIENEYGSFGNDKSYLNHLRELFVENQVDVPFFTTDGSADYHLVNGTLPDVWKAVNFRLDVEHSLEQLRKHQPDKPLLVGEFWSGRSSHWGEEYTPKDIVPVADALQKILKMESNVCFYMFSGGTNFGFMNGANFDFDAMRYKPLVTSYDVDALLTEYGHPTEKYYTCQKVLAKHLGKPIVSSEPAKYTPKAYGKIKLDKFAYLFKNLNEISTSVTVPYPLSMEEMGQDYGFILYSTTIVGKQEKRRLAIDGLRDRATIYVNGDYVGTMMRGREEECEIWLEPNEDGLKLQILVENMGRICFGPCLKDRKGIIGGVRLGATYLHNWTIHTIPLTNIDTLEYSNQFIYDEKPAFYKGSLDVTECLDTFLYLDEWDKGNVWINGFNIGKYWNIGPQKTLYVPGALLNKGANQVVVFDIHHQSSDITVEFIDKHILDRQADENTK